MIIVTSTNRSGAKRLLNNWHDSREVRTWTLAELTSRINQAIADGLITVEGAQRILSAEKAIPTPRKASGNSAKGERNGERDPEEQPASGESDKGGAEQGDEGEEQETEEQQGAEEGSQGDEGEESQRESDSDGSESGEGDSDGSEPGEGGEESESEQSAQDQQQQPGSDAPLDADTVQAMIDRAIKQHQANDGHAVRRVIIKDAGESKKIDGAHHMLPDVLRYIKAGLNVALVGPAGTGKSTIAHMSAKILEKQFRGCGAMLTKYDLVGFKDAAGVYHTTPLYEAYTEGHLFCFDELDASSPDAVVAFNAITDNQNVYAFPNGMHEKNPGFVAVACMNTWGAGADADYVGRFKQDAAAMSRFVRVYIDYDRNIEESLGDADIVGRIWKLRDACKTLGVRHVVSTRMITQAQAARNVGTPNKAIDRDILFAGLTESTIKQLASQMK